MVLSSRAHVVPPALTLCFLAPFTKLRFGETKARTCSHVRAPRVQVATREERRCGAVAHLNSILCHRRNALSFPQAAHNFDCVAVEFLWVAVLGSSEFEARQESW